MLLLKWLHQFLKYSQQPLHIQSNNLLIHISCSLLIFKNFQHYGLNPYSKLKHLVMLPQSILKHLRYCKIQIRICLSYLFHIQFVVLKLQITLWSMAYKVEAVLGGKNIILIKANVAFKELASSESWPEALFMKSKAFKVSLFVIR